MLGPFFTNLGFQSVFKRKNRDWRQENPQKFWHFPQNPLSLHPQTSNWSDARVAEEARLESVYTSKAYREFESRSLRKAAHSNQHDLDAPLFSCRYRPAKLQPTATKQTYSTTRQGFSPPVCAGSPEPIGGVRLQPGGG